ncbi:MAG: hypothetical protein ACI4JM_00015 [Oscillospiraceae bacterium]
MNFITVKEFAALANVTTQAVYKRISQQDSNIQQYIKIDGKYKLISTDALKLFAEENIENDEQNSDNSKKPEPEAAPQPEKPAAEKPESMLPSTDEHKLLNHTTDKLVSSLENHIDDLKKEIETLRNELAEKNMQLSNLNERLANEQELHRHNQLLLVSTQENDTEKESEKNSGFFKKLFKK